LQVLTALGRPSRVFILPDTKLSIHASSASTSAPRPVWRSGTAAASRSDYILNFFDVGLDVVIDGTTHTLKKIVMHTNLPG
jgi:hypothetical protein